MAHVSRVIGKLDVAPRPQATLVAPFRAWASDNTVVVLSRNVYQLTKQNGWRCGSR